MAAVTIHSNFGPKKIKSVTVSNFFHSICYEVIGLDAVVLVFLMLSFKPNFSFSSFTLGDRDLNFAYHRNYVELFSNSEHEDFLFHS